MTRTAASVRAVALAVALSALGLSACQNFSMPHPFHRTHASSASPGQRISLLELNEQLRVSDTLKGQDFYLPPPQPLSAWPLPGGDLEQSVEHVEAAPNFQIAWRRGFGRASNRHVHVTAPPIMAEGKVFVMDAMAEVSAHDAGTGAQVWRVNLEPKSRRDHEAFGGGLAYADGKVYVSSGFRLVAAINAADGHVDWVSRTDAPVHAAPTVADGRVFVVDVDDELLTFNAASGAPDWTYQALTEPARIVAASSPAVSGDTLVASFASGELVALRASNGTQLWEQSLSHTTTSRALSEIRDIAGRPAIYKGDVFAVSHAEMMAATDLRTGAQRWSLPISGITTPWPAGDVVFVVDQTGAVICALRQTGGIYWITNLNTVPPKAKGKKASRIARVVWSSPILASGRLITVSSAGEAVALDPKTGAVQRRLKLGDDALIGPIAANGTIYVATQKADLIAIR
ncbi:MAG: PQQ-binding-like beta-propeller repeat protein [Caulobacteraceae bacterium]|nr:PQQ-binding-like beta-propeller repeat protein [Caulobacteraceae bacterium]